AAVAAVLFAEVAQQCVCLAAGVLDQVDDVLDACDLLLLATREALGQIGHKPGDVGVVDETGKAQARARDLQLNQALIGQVLQGAYQTLPILTQHRRHLVQCQSVPLAAFFGAGEDTLEELSPLAAEAGDDSLQWYE